jgi:hypothetical protein
MHNNNNNQMEFKFAKVDLLVATVNNRKSIYILIKGN